MSEFPDRVNFLTADDVFLHYSLLFEDETRTIYADCDHCDDIVATLTYDEVTDMDEMDVYETIIDRHRPIE